MAELESHFEEAKKTAEKRFLGQGPIVGVGSIGQEQDTLVFLLADDSTEYRNLIKKWGRSVSVPVHFIITGVNKP